MLARCGSGCRRRSLRNNAGVTAERAARWAPPRAQARRYLVATCAGWPLWLAAVLVTQGALAVAAPTWAYAIALGFQIEHGVDEPRGLLDYCLPGRRRPLRARLASPVNQLRPSFLHDVATASGWNAGMVLSILGVLTVAGCVVPLL